VTEMTSAGEPVFFRMTARMVVGGGDILVGGRG
jgi:hypothetical protein